MPAPIRFVFAIGACSASALLLAGCAGKAHRLSGFGVSNRDAFAGQIARRDQRPVEPNTTLGSQEAEVIAQSHLRGLSGKAKAEPEPVLYVVPQREGTAAPPPLPPSVPKK